MVQIQCSLVVLDSEFASFVAPVAPIADPACGSYWSSNWARTRSGDGPQRFQGRMAFQKSSRCQAGWSQNVTKVPETSSNFPGIWGILTCLFRVWKSCGKKGESSRSSGLNLHISEDFSDHSAQSDPLLMSFAQWLRQPVGSVNYDKRTGDTWYATLAPLFFVKKAFNVIFAPIDAPSQGIFDNNLFSLEISQTFPTQNGFLQVFRVSPSLVAYILFWLTNSRPLLLATPMVSLHTRK